MRNTNVTLWVIVVLLVGLWPAKPALADPAWIIQTVDPLGGAYSSIAFAPNGNPVISYKVGGLKYATWNGSAWDTQMVESGNLGHNCSLALDAQGKPRISYVDWSNKNLKYAAWNGSSWDIQVVDTDGVCNDTSLVLDSIGRPRISYGTYDGLKYAVSNGSFWNMQTVDSSGSWAGNYNSLALDSQDNPCIAYSNLGTVLKYATWNGAFWNIVVVDSGGSQVAVPSLVLNDSDQPRISYGLSSGIKYASWNGTSWDIEIVDATGGTNTSLVLNDEGDPRISYAFIPNFPDHDVKYASWSGDSWDIQTVDVNGWVGYTGTSLALDSSNNPYISYLYWSNSGNKLKLAYVYKPAKPPVADADGPYVIYVGDTLTLDASSSTDDDNDITSYMWDLDDDESFETDAGGQAIFDVNYTYLQSLGLLVDYLYDIHVQVTDSEGQSDVADSTLIIVPQPATVVAVDIKPGSCPNPVNVKSSGVLPIAILGTDDYDVTTIDATSVRLAGVEPLRSEYEDVAAPVSDSNDCNCTEDGPDGFLDLTLKFKTQRIVEIIGDVNDGDVLTLELTGVLYDPIPFETPIEGADCILIKGWHKAHNKADINKDGVVDMTDFAIISENWLQSSVVED